MKIIGTDNLARESVAEFVWQDGFSNSIEMRAALELVCERLNQGLADTSGTFYKVVVDEYKLWRGMEELV